MIYLMCLSKLFCYSSIFVTSFVIIVYLTYQNLYLSVFICFWAAELLAVIVIGAARDIGYFNEQTYLEFMPQFPYHL